MIFSRLDADTLAYLFASLSLPSLCRLRSTCKDADRLVAAELDFRLTKTLLPFFEDPAGLRVLLRKTDSVVSGSVAVRLASGVDFPPNDLDVYTTSEHAATVGSFLAAQGYVPVGSLDPHLPEYRGGIKRINRYARGSQSIDLVVSLTQSATLPIVYFWSTPVMSFFGGDGFTLLYPCLLEQGKGLLNPGRCFSDVDRLSGLVNKYKERGFRIEEEEIDFTLAGHSIPPCKARLSATCPVNTRFIGDRFCLQTTFGTVDVRCKSQPYSGTLSSLTNVWWRGGRGCGSDCSSSAVTDFDAWTQSADIVGL